MLGSPVQWLHKRMQELQNLWQITDQEIEIF
jgi:hypothetical protein